MSISAISSTTTADQTDFTKRMSQGKKDFKALEDALKSGDLDAAKSAFETIKKNKPSGPPPGGGPQGGGPGGSGKQGGGPESDFASLESALSSGDVKAAQKAFATIKSHMRHGADQGQDQDQSSGSNASVSKSISSDLQGTLLDMVA